LKARIKEIAATRVRYGYRRVHVLLRREGWPVNAKRIYRLYKEMGLQLRNKTPKRRVKAKLREDRTEAVHSNDVWAMDFVHDQLATGRRIRVLTVVDTFSRFSPVVDPRFSYRGEDVVADAGTGMQVGRLSQRRSGSTRVRSSSPAILIYGHTPITSSSTSRGRASPRTMRSSSPSTASSGAECLNAHWFLTLDDARAKMEEWRKDYNNVRPHSAIGNKPPISLMKGSSAASAA
jgi:putative transposase